jgi:hypothetical protein
VRASVYDEAGTPLRYGCAALGVVRTHGPGGFAQKEVTVPAKQRGSVFKLRDGVGLPARV